MRRKIRSPKSEGRKKAEVRNPNRTTLFFCPNVFAFAGFASSFLNCAQNGFNLRNRGIRGIRERVRPHFSVFRVFRGFSSALFGHGYARLGYRVSAFFRPSDFGLRIFTLALILTPFITLAADTNDASDLPTSSLLPPRGEIPPTFWEQYGTWVLLGLVLLLGIISFGAWALTRPKPPVQVPYAVQARQELEPLLQQPENGILLSRASQILRHYVALMFALPSGELTTTEFCEALVSNPKIGRELGTQTTEFLKTCDLHKFAPRPPGSSAGAVGRALSIIDRAETRLAEVNRIAATHSNSTPPPISGQAQRQPSGP